MLDLLNPYYWAVSLRNWAYDHGLISSCRFELPVISVGNLSLGGSGKSTLVRYICSLLGSRMRVCIVSRGYGRQSRGTVLVSEWGNVKKGWQESGDEPYMLAKLLPMVSVVVDEDRCRGVAYALEKVQPEVIILDDGFQHRRIDRDLNILLLKKQDLSDRLLPFGRLREPLSSMERADLLILSYAELDTFEWKHPHKPTLQMKRHSWRVVRSTDGRELRETEGLKFVAFSGLGDNSQFFRRLQLMGIKLEKTIALPDHYSYRGFQIEKDKLYLTTMKDMVKLNPSENLFYLDFDVSVDGLVEILEGTLFKKMSLTSF